jgi:hypothetical protein
MKKLLLLLLLLPLFGIGQNIAIRSASTFEKDGRIWVSYDGKDSKVQRFHPIEDVYQCKGMFIKIITDTVKTKDTYRLFFGKDWCDVKDKRMAEFTLCPDDMCAFNKHIMFQVMAACFDKDFIYCQCGEKFPIIQKSFK